MPRLPQNFAALDPGRQPVTTEHRLVFDVFQGNSVGRRHAEALDPLAAAFCAEPFAQLAAHVAHPLDVRHDFGVGRQVRSVRGKVRRSVRRPLPVRPGLKGHR